MPELFAWIILSHFFFSFPLPVADLSSQEHLTFLEVLFSMKQEGIFLIKKILEHNKNSDGEPPFM